MRKTKIICTHPAVDNPEVLEKLLKKGMDIPYEFFPRDQRHKQGWKSSNDKRKLGLPIPYFDVRRRLESANLNLTSKLGRRSSFILLHDDELGDNTRYQYLIKIYTRMYRGTCIPITMD